MIDLLEAYSISDILIFIVLLALAFKEIISFFDWARERTKKVTDKDYKNKQDKMTLEAEVKDLEKFYQEKEKVDEGFAKNEKHYQELQDQINLLIHSDVVNMRCQITDKYHQFIEQKWIDDRSMMCLEDIYTVYKQEGGNHFVETLMTELRALPKCPPEEKA